MAASVSMNLTMADGRPMAVLSDLIEKRKKAMNETSRDACIATTITVLQSVRARTHVADPESANGTVGLRQDLVPGFRTVAGRRVPCVRVGSPKGAVYTGSWKLAVKGMVISPQLTKCYFVREIASKDDFSKQKKTYVILANSEDEAKQWATALRKRRIERYSGLARYALGVAMAATSDRAGSAGAANSFIKKVTDGNVVVSKDDPGWNSGSFTVEVRDLLNYATMAVEGGEATVQLALMKAANSTAAKINKAAASPLTETIETPFPEVKGR